MSCKSEIADMQAVPFLPGSCRIHASKYAIVWQTRMLNKCSLRFAAAAIIMENACDQTAFTSADLRPRSQTTDFRLRATFNSRPLYTTCGDGATRRVWHIRSMHLSPSNASRFSYNTINFNIQLFKVCH